MQIQQFIRHFKQVNNRRLAAFIRKLIMPLEDVLSDENDRFCISLPLS
jgi:hypothetical protein